MLVIAADHRARGVMTIENYDAYLDAVSAAVAEADGILATARPLEDLRASGVVGEQHRTYLSINRTGLAGSVFELDDRLVASVARARRDGLTGVKHMIRIDPADTRTADALALLGQVLEQAAELGLEALVEAVRWRDATMSRDVDDIVFAAVVANDLGARLLKVPVPACSDRRQRVDAVARVVGSVGAPVLFLGGPHRGDDEEAILDEVADVMAGGGAGMAVGRAVIQAPDPGGMARRIRALVSG